MSSQSGKDVPSQAAPKPEDASPAAKPRPTFNPEEENTTVSMPPPTLEAGWASARPRVRDRGTLTVLAGPNLGAMYTLATTPAVIGRARDCAIRLDDAMISRQHARVRQTEEGYVIEDLGSRNGTFLNGNRVESAVVREGDRISFGSALMLRFGMTDELEEALLRRLYESSVLDALTGAFNRKHFADRLAEEVAYATRHRSPLSLLLIDIDHFKQVNDTYGHLAGDRVLASLASIIKRSMRAEDIFARYGGEEFVIIARGTDLRHALRFAERVRVVVEQSDIPVDGNTLRITISVGLASLGCCLGEGSSQQILEIADRRLYAAKAAGRNRCVST